MINFEKIKYEKCQLPLLRRLAPAPNFHVLFKFFRFPPPSTGGNQDLLPPTFKKEGAGVVRAMVGITLVDILQNRLNWFQFFFVEGGLLIILIDCIIFLSTF